MAGGDGDSDSAGRGGTAGGGGGGGGGGDTNRNQMQNTRLFMFNAQRRQKYTALTSGDVKASIQSHWETLQQWRIDEGKNFARSRGSQIARMAAGGMKEGSQQWEANLAQLDVAHEKEMQRLNDSATMGILNNWTADMKANAPRRQTVDEDGNLSYAEAADTRTTEELLTANFGLTKKYSEYQDVDGSRAAAAAKESKRQNAQRAQIQQASPWWA